MVVGGCAGPPAAGLAWELDGCAPPAGGGRAAPLLGAPTAPLGFAPPDESDVDVVDGAFAWDFFPSTLDLISSFTLDSFWPMIDDGCGKMQTEDG